MKTNNFLTNKWCVSVPFAVMMMFTCISCQKEKRTIDAAETISGEEIFKGIYFANGSFANDLSTQRSKHELYASLDQSAREELEKKIELVVDLIHKEFPTFFNDFKKKISSHNHFLVKEALSEGAKHIAENFEKAFPEMIPLAEKIHEDIKNHVITTDGRVDPAKIELQKNEYDKLLSNNMITSSSPKRICTIGLVCVFYIALAVHSYAAVSTVAAVAIMTWSYVAFIPDIDIRQGGDPLEFEMMVDELVKLDRFEKHF
jgi:SdpC family antimicrobial peptide